MADSFKESLKYLHRVVRSEVLGADNSNDLTLYHYTHPDGLINILKRSALWATSIRHFIDRSELLYAETIWETVLGEVTTQYESGSVQHELAGKCRLEPRPWPTQGPLSPDSGLRRPWWNVVLDIYVTCFSTHDDLAHQWKNYARGGAGFAIGFCGHELSKSIQDHHWTSAYLAKVRYSPEDQKRELRNIFDRYCALLAATDLSNTEACADGAVKSFALRAILFKHPAFEAEHEVRLIIETLPGREDIEFRAAVDQIIPYVYTHPGGCSKLPVKSVTIGPAMDQEASAGGIQSLLDAKCYRRVDIRSANISTAC